MSQNAAHILEAFHSGEADHIYTFLGCHKAHRDGREGFVFRVWAPRAQTVSVIGDFNFWNEEDLPMHPIGGGVWEAFSVYAKAGGAYKYCLTGQSGARFHKTDPYAVYCRPLPDKSGVIWETDGFVWHDDVYRRRLAAKGTAGQLKRPINIYELHLGSWRTHPDGTPYSYTELADALAEYLTDMHYTHVELMPLGEYPYDGSWGYQVTGYYAPTFRYGTPQDFMRFVDRLHEAGIGVILDWVPAHFPKDAHGLYEFDGSCCYELSDPEMNEHPDWTTRIFDYGKGEVRSFLVSNAVYWLERYHVDGIRVDAVASMLYLDYNRPHYKPNRFGGKENLEAIDFLRALNRAAFAENPAALMIAEESTAFPMITKPDYDGGLGFLYKWNMGWMNDILNYMAQDPLFRKGCHHFLTFSMSYAFSENFILPLSHDEVVHGKRSLVDRMPGDYDAKFANLRLLYAFMMAHPGKKLSFMGNEFAQFGEWNYQKELDWMLLGYDRHRQMRDYVRALNAFYLAERPLWENECGWDGFRWIQPDDCDNSVIALRRIDRKGHEVIVLINFCPVRREAYRIGLPKGGYYVPVLNSDDAAFGGSGEELPPVRAKKIPWGDHAWSGTFTLPPLCAVYYKIRRPKNPAKRQ
ncbi:MAG: 1,4-alpha-glucan branching protein GlgB [Oscillospiraceae bacterium]|nr:1,4-alpha-glucan branching protein GlgB [Oscillospiraceae bacterium]